MYGLESTCWNKNSTNSYIRFSLYKIHWNNLTNAVLKELSKDRLFSSVVRSEQEIQMRDLIDKNLDHVLFIQKNQPRELSKDEVDDLVRIIKKEISRPRISLKLS